MIPSRAKSSGAERDVSLSLEVNAESKPSLDPCPQRRQEAAADCETWDKAMRELAAKNLTELANNWLSQDEENPAIRKQTPSQRRNSPGGSA